MDAVGKTMDGRPSAEKVNVLMQAKTSEVVTSEVFCLKNLHIYDIEKYSSLSHKKSYHEDPSFTTPSCHSLSSS